MSEISDYLKTWGKTLGLFTLSVIVIGSGSYFGAYMAEKSRQQYASKIKERVERTLEEYDLNHDEHLDNLEWGNFRQPFYDKNKDGFVDTEELSHFIAITK